MGLQFGHFLLVFGPDAVPRPFRIADRVLPVHFRLVSVYNKPNAPSNVRFSNLPAGQLITCVTKLQSVLFGFAPFSSADSVSDSDSISASLGPDLHRLALASRKAAA
jgi:hypothetical protein